MTEDTIDALERFLRGNDDYALAAPLMVNENDELQYNTALKVIPAMPYILAIEILYSRRFKPFYYKDIEAEEGEIKTVDGVSGSMFMMNVEKMLQCGLFDEDLFLYGEEIVLSLLMKREGLKAGLLLREKFVHKHSVSISKTYPTLTARKKILMKSHLYILRKYYRLKGIPYGFAWLVSRVAICEAGIISFWWKHKKKLTGV